LKPPQKPYQLVNSFSEIQLQLLATRLPSGSQEDALFSRFSCLRWLPKAEMRFHTRFPAFVTVDSDVQTGISLTIS